MPWIVDIIESEIGWGRKVDSSVSFSTRDEAVKYQKKFNQPNYDDYAKTGKVPSWYMQASDPYWIDNDKS